LSIKVECKVDLHGIDDELREVGPKIAKRLFRRALNSVGKIFVENIRGEAPEGDGALKNSIASTVSIRKAKDGSGAVGTLTVGPKYDRSANNGGGSRTENPGIYGLFVEYGLKRKKYRFTPFMRPVFDATAEQMIQTFADGLREDLEQAIKE